MKSLSRKITMFLLVFSLMLTTVLAIAPKENVEAAETTYAGQIWKTKSVKLRKSKSTKSKVLTKIKKGKSVQVYGTYGKWRKVAYNGKVGYVKKQYVYISTNAPSLDGEAEAKGQTVANFAKRFVGNPYVYGGTSLNSGTDCSGFVGSVYKAFGYNMPRSSSEFRSVGKKVSYSDRQPGDIICYKGHVALCIEGGKIVHASSKKTGIKISSKANYRSIVTIRRVVE